MAAAVTEIKLGPVNCFLLQDKGAILVDAGYPGNLKAFRRKIERLKLDFTAVKLIVITHGHIDHCGSAREIKELTGAPLAVHLDDAEALKEGKPQFPPGLNGWGRALAAVMRPLAGLSRPPAVKPDIILDDEFSLSEFGVNGRVLHTPGHTAGSVSVILDSGEALVGDLCMNGLPMRLGPGMPIFGDSAAKIRESWTRLLNAGAHTVYPGHGKPFSAQVLKEALDKGI